MPDRIALVAVQDELRLGGSAGGEIEQQRVGCARLPIGKECRGERRQIVIAMPAGGRVADDDPGDAAVEPVEFYAVATR